MALYVYALDQACFPYEGTPLRGDQSVYFIHCPPVRRVKIGTTHNIGRRLKSLQRDMYALELVLWGVIDGGHFVENLIHQKFAVYRIAGEWFSDEIEDDVRELIRLDQEFFGDA